MAATSPKNDKNEVTAEKAKSVNEINGIANGSNDAATQNGTKRKLPSWMVAASNTKEDDDEDESTQSKRSKSNNEGNEDTDGSNEADSSQRVQNAQSKDESQVGESEMGTEEAQSSDSNNEHSSTVDTQVGASSNSNAIQVKVEPVDPEESNVNASTSNGITSDIKPAIKVEKADASSTSRESCKFGIRCYRRNPMHRIEESHPGDHDYKRPNYPSPPDGVPNCPYGSCCYRRNPTHFQAYKHPDDTDFQQNYRNYRLRQRKRQQKQNNGNNDENDDSDLDDYDLDDPFINDDSDLDYVPSSDEEENTEELDYDDCDKAEE